MAELFDTYRFIKAQEEDNAYESALQEVRNGRKESHWIWYIFPQLRELGQSAMSRTYGISSLLEARAYLEEPILKDNLYEITHALKETCWNGITPEDVFGELDAMKVRSCLTLFDIVDPYGIYAEVLKECFEDTRCRLTIDMTKEEYDRYYDDDIIDEYNIDRKALFEKCSAECHRYPIEAIIGTYVDLAAKGYSIRRLAEKYFYRRDASPYRVSGVYTTIDIYIHDFTRSCYPILNKEGNEELKTDIVGYVKSRGDNDLTVLQIADLLDGLLKAITSDDEYADYVAVAREKTLLKHPKPKI